jgi:hypothetical protein
MNEYFVKTVGVGLLMLLVVLFLVVVILPHLLNYAPPTVTARVVLRERIADTALPLAVSPDNPYQSEPVTILDDGATWLSVRLPDGRELRINQDVVAGLIYIQATPGKEN